MSFAFGLLLEKYHLWIEFFSSPEVFSYFLSPASSVNLFRSLLNAYCVCVLLVKAIWEWKGKRHDACSWTNRRQVNNLQCLHDSYSKYDVYIKCYETTDEGEVNSVGKERHRYGVFLSRALKDGQELVFWLKYRL